jgi:hypothetical protein
MGGTAQVFSEASSLSTTGQLLAILTRLKTMRVTSRSVVDRFCIGTLRLKFDHGYLLGDPAYVLIPFAVKGAP